MNMQRLGVPAVVVFCLGLAGVLGTTAFAQGGIPAGSPTQDEILQAVTAELGVTEAYLQELELPFDPPAEFPISLAFAGRKLPVQLTLHSLRSEGFRLLAQIETGEIVEQEAAPPRTYRGTIEGIEASGGAFSLTPEGQLEGIVLLDEGDEAVLLVVAPVSRWVPEAPPSMHVVFRSQDVVLPEEYLCGVPTPAFDGSLNGPAVGGGPVPLVTGLKICDIAFDADREFYVLNGSNVINTMFDIENVMNSVEFIYERDVMVTYEVTTILVRTAEPDPYSSTDAATLLNQFQAEWSSNQAGVKRDVAHLMTGKNLNGGTIGIAQLSSVCNVAWGVGLSESRFTGIMSQRAALTAHELGHNWSAQHCSGSDCRIMCPTLGSCSGDITKFGNQAKSQISSYRNSAACLVDLADPVIPPFVDTFPFNTLDTANWIYSDGVGVTAGATNEPTPLYAMNLDSTGSGSNDNDDVRSNEIKLGGQGLVTLSYYTEHRGPAAGETLTVEYWASNTRWSPLQTIVSDGVDQDWFRFHYHLLPSTAKHDGFRLRFRTDGSGATDDWYIDNVSVAPTEVTLALVPQNTSAAPGGQIVFDAFVTNQNAGSPKSVQAWVDVVKPDGSPFSAGGNPKFGPKSFNVGPGATKQKLNIKLNIPASATSGSGYRVIGIVGDFDASLVGYVSDFDFTVTP